MCNALYRWLENRRRLACIKGRGRFVRVFLTIAFLFTTHLHAQHEHHTTSADTQEQPSEPNPATQFLFTEGAGTATHPELTSMSMPTNKAWNWMPHWYAFLNSIQQTGPRGDDQIFSTNHFMMIGSHEFNESSTLLLRGMLSLEPATVVDRQYPLLFQTGETAFDHPIIDGQHPHDFFMELSVQFAMELRKDLLLHLYAAPVGDPALGPVAYPHRISAQELPQATLSHHLQDSTHIAFDVLTAGLKYKNVRLEFCGFHGAEPDEDRWDIEHGAIDSWSTRITFTPNPKWTAQFSTGHLNNPEAHDPEDIHRTTASVTNYIPTTNGFWAASVIWGHNRKVELDRNLNSYSLETLYQFKSNYLTGRIEIVDKDELFEEHDDEHDEGSESPDQTVFRINSFTFGYARDFRLIPGLRTGIGANFTLYSFPSVLENFYGDNPKSFLIYFRIGSPHHAQHEAKAHSH